MFDILNAGVEPKGYDTEQKNGCDHHIQLKYLGSINDQISKTSSGGKEFSDNDTYQSQTNIDFSGAEQDGDRTGKNYFEEHVFFGAAQCAYQC